MKTFSLNAAATLIEKDRATLVRALRRTPPDACEGRHPRWRLRTILDALATHEQQVAVQTGGYPRSDIADRCDAAFAEFDQRFDAMKAAPTLTQRREMSIALAPLIAESINLMKARDTADGLHPDHVDLRGDRVFMLLMVGFEGPCKWTRDEVCKYLDATGKDDPDA